MVVNKISPTTETKGYCCWIANSGIEDAVLEKSVGLEFVWLWIFHRVVEHVPVGVPVVTEIVESQMWRMRTKRSMGDEISMRTSIFDA